MKTTIISYSFTGNNAALATRLAAELSAEHISITEAKPRTNGIIALDMMLNRTPAVTPNVSSAADSDWIIFVGPVWMGQVAAPLRACFKQLKGQLKHYAFVTISGGAMGPNPKLSRELRKRVRREADIVIDKQIVHLLPADPPPTRDDTSAYRLTDEDVSNLTAEIAQSLRDVMAV